MKSRAEGAACGRNHASALGRIAPGAAVSFGGALGGLSARGGESVRGAMVTTRTGAAAGGGIARPKAKDVFASGRACCCGSAEYERAPPGCCAARPALWRADIGWALSGRELEGCGESTVMVLEL